MHLDGTVLRLSPSDVTAFLACEHLTTLSLAHARGEIDRPDVENEQAELIFRKGLEHERAYLVWRATTEASYLEDARVGEVLRQRGKVLDGIAYLLDLWRNYPSTASIQSDFFGLAQVVAGLAGRATSDPAIRGELAAAGATRSDLLLQAIRLDQAFRQGEIVLVGQLVQQPALQPRAAGEAVVTLDLLAHALAQSRQIVGAAREGHAEDQRGHDEPGRDEAGSWHVSPPSGDTDRESCRGARNGGNRNAGSGR